MNRKLVEPLEKLVRSNLIFLRGEEGITETIKTLSFGNVHVIGPGDDKELRWCYDAEFSNLLHSAGVKNGFAQYQPPENPVRHITQEKLPEGVVLVKIGYSDNRYEIHRTRETLAEYEEMVKEGMIGGRFSKTKLETYWKRIMYIRKQDPADKKELSTNTA